MRWRMYFGKVKKQNSDRVPPNQRVTKGWPVLHVGDVPYYEKDLSNWDLRIGGLVERPTVLTFEQLMALPETSQTNDIHCVTGWSKFDNEWEGIATRTIADHVGIRKEARFVMLEAEEGWTTNLPLEDFLAESSLLAYKHNGKMLTPEHGYPIRMVVPHLYFWKSAKWIRAIKFRSENQQGFWERNGYHMYGNPWKEQRFAWD